MRGSTLRNVDGRAVWPLVNFLALAVAVPEFEFVVGSIHPLIASSGLRERYIRSPRAAYLPHLPPHEPSNRTFVIRANDRGGLEANRCCVRFRPPFDLPISRRRKLGRRQADRDVHATKWSLGSVPG